VVVLEKNRRSTTPILKCAFALIAKNPDVFTQGEEPASPRRPLISAREENAKQQGQEFPSLPVEAVVLEGRAVESTDLVETIIRRQRQTHCPWSEFAVLYRIHSHRDQIAEELAERQIPFSIESMDVLDAAEVRDLLACAGAVVSKFDDASLFRVAALRQFTIDPHELRVGMKALPRDAAQGSLASVLKVMGGGTAVLEAVQQTRDEVDRQAAKGRVALDIIVRGFALDRNTPALRAVLDFAGEWEGKAITRTGEMSELLEYLNYFREAGGVIPLPTTQEDAVRLFTVHSAKGLEFRHVFIVRANSSSFPAGYREPLIEFPRELRDADSVAEDDDKALSEQEERRLFYVAMTRACDSLSIYACKGKGKKDTTPAGYLRDLLKDSSLEKFLHSRTSRGFQTDLFGQASSPAPTASRTEEWVKLPPASNLQARLSATAVDTYKTCPLQFKLERDWRIPGDVPAAMQYGAAMHRVLRAYYESVRCNRSMTEDALVELFLADPGHAGMQDQYQRELYAKQGVAQLREFLETVRRSPAPEILHLEEPFEVKIGNSTVVGRIDRVDRTDGGRVIITDYKTGRPRLQEDADASLQLSIYTLAAREKWGYETDHLIFYNLEGNVPVVTRRDEGQLHEARCEVEDVTKDIEAGKFEPTPGRHCNFCAYRSLCPATERRITISSLEKRGSRKRQGASH
jgi:ATP-dependent exoDNAse (exonuclease V) beta subunit